MRNVRSIYNYLLTGKKHIYSLLLVCVAVYPLRWTFCGLDLWDSGYNCANFVNYGPEYMTPKLFFSTYLSTLVGHIMSLMPYGHTYAGLRFYCGLVIVFNVLISALFCIRRLGIDRRLVISGELLAISLCYNPSVVLYNHLSFLFLNISVILLYEGMTGAKKVYLVIAGLFLGLNVFVRFPNITQAALILAVWLYLFMVKTDIGEYIVQTFACFAGYFAGVILVLSIVGIIYGLDAYIDSMTELMNISGHAGDYSPMSMVYVMGEAYIRGARRLFDMAVFSFLASVAVRAVHGRRRVVYIISGISGVVLCFYFVVRRLVQFNFHHYEVIVLSAAMFIDAAIVICIIRIAGKNTNREEKLMAALILLESAVLSVGSNTGISPVMNSLFITAPFMLDGLVRLCKKYIYTERGDGIMDHLPACTCVVCIVAFAFFYIQCILFGAGYTYQEAKNGAGGSDTVYDNAVLTGIKMEGKRADMMQKLTDYVNDHHLSGKDVIVYGYVPALVFYLDMKPALTTWPDLDSYSISEMERDMTLIEEDIDKGVSGCPVILIVDMQNEVETAWGKEKLKMLREFIDKYEYGKCYKEDGFEIYIEE